ncbi:MAG: YncE family protein, partial [Rhodospirillales bacterium]|nr:YncE family protein [Rhodospirillales bacterium]
RGAHQLFPSPDGKLIYVNNRVDSTAVALDARTLKEVRSYKLPGGPDDLVFAPDGHIWFTMRFAHRVAVLNPATGDVRTIEVGRSPHGIFLNAAATVK